MDSIITGVNYMLIGMGAVFLFLLLLVASMGLIRKIFGSQEASQTDGELQRMAAAAGAAFRIRSNGDTHEKN